MQNPIEWREKYEISHKKLFISLFVPIPASQPSEHIMIPPPGLCRLVDLSIRVVLLDGNTM